MMAREGHRLGLRIRAGNMHSSGQAGTQTVEPVCAAVPTDSGWGRKLTLIVEETDHENR
jgi:hypothetical protein